MRKTNMKQITQMPAEVIKEQGGHDHTSTEHWSKTKCQVMLIKVESYKKLFWNKQF